MDQKEEMLKQLHTELRNSRGKIAVLLGAGSSYDYGIPTMKEMAKILADEILAEESKFGLSKETLLLLASVTGIVKGAKQKKEWNIEQLISRLHQLKEAILTKEEIFKSITASIDKESLDGDKIEQAENELIRFMAKLCQLESCECTAHGDKSIIYLSDFFQILSSFQNSLKVFTTNIDLCIEAAIVRLSHQARNISRKDFILIDGFTSGPVPKFDIRNYLIQQPDSSSRIFPLFLWKLHGSIDWTYSMPIDENVELDPKQKIKFNDDAIICKKYDNGQWTNFFKAKALSVDGSMKGQEIMIFPTPDKYFQTYSNPYIDLYESFRRTLEQDNTQVLLAIGTSFPDQHIKAAIKSFVQRDNTSLYIVDPDESLNEAKVKELLGSCKGINPVIHLGFKAFVSKLQTIEELTDEKQVKNE